MTNNGKIIADLKSSPMIEALLVKCKEKMSNEGFEDHLDVVFEVAPYYGKNKPKIEDFLSENKHFGVEVFEDSEYPQEDTVEMKVITNIQLCLQEMLDEE